MSSYANSFRGLLESTLAVLNREAKLHARQAANELGGRKVALHIEAENLCLQRGTETLELCIDSETPDPDIRVNIDADTLVALINERLPFLHALNIQRIRVWGHHEDLWHAQRACYSLVHGLVRAPSGPELLVRLRQLQKHMTGT